MAYVTQKSASEGKAMDGCPGLQEILQIDVKQVEKEQKDDDLLFSMDATMAHFAASKGAVYCGLLTVFVNQVAVTKTTQKITIDWARAIQTNHPYDTLVLLSQLMKEQDRQVPEKLIVNVAVVFAQWGDKAIGLTDERLMQQHDQLIKGGDDEHHPVSHSSFAIINFKSQTIDYQDPHGKSAPWLGLVQAAVLKRLTPLVDQDLGKFTLQTLDASLEKPFADAYYEGNVFAGGTSAWWSSLTLFLYLACPTLATADVEKELAAREKGGIDLGDLFKKWIGWIIRYQGQNPAIRRAVAALEHPAQPLLPGTVRQAWYMMLVHGNPNKALGLVQDWLKKHVFVH